MQTHPYIIPQFIGAHGNMCTASQETITDIEALLGTSQLDKCALPPVHVIEENSEAIVHIKVTGQWQLILENGTTLANGEVSGQSIILPENMPQGYHQLVINDNQNTWESRIIVTPKHAYLPQCLHEQKKILGTSLQMYSLRSEKNWGIGDFSDLQFFLQEFAKHGGGFVGLNPIHALMPNAPECASPYSPSSRLWLNIIYIDLNSVEAFQQSELAQQWFSQPEIQRELAHNRSVEYIDYTRVMSLKMEALELAYKHFEQSTCSDFEDFIISSAEPLMIQATFDAIHSHLESQGQPQPDWHEWDEEFQHYNSSSVQAFQERNQSCIRFYCWLQYLAQQQLQKCHESAQQADMPLGIYRDLAIGVCAHSAEAWADRELYVNNVSIGAPPDIMAPQGQGWGLCPMHPEILQMRAYQPFIDLLQSNMKDCAALRIDHILGFARFWWAPQGKPASEGVYVRYPLSDMLGILALESQRNQCTLIGEALGIVPEGLLDELAKKHILSYNIFYFEMDDGACKRLDKYPQLSMTATSTHDLPTIKGFWHNEDLRLGKELGIYPNEEITANLEQDRSRVKHAIQEAMEQSGVESLKEKPLSHKLQIHAAATNSLLYSLQPEDWLDMMTPVNIPGTSDNYPNWRRKLSVNCEDIFTDETIIDLLKRCVQQRSV